METEIKNKVVESELYKLYKKHGLLTAKIVVKEAKKKDSPLHEHFEWNDTKAADQYRLMQARAMIRKVKIKVTTEVGDLRVRKYVNIRTGSNPTVTNPFGKNSSYHELNDVISDENKKEVMFQQALNDLLAFRRKYANLKVFENIFAEIDRIVAA